MTSPDQKVDHAEEARRLLEFSRREGSDESSPAMHAQAHASLAIAEELRGIREALGGKSKPSLDPDWQEFTSWCEKQVAHEEKEMAQAGTAAMRELHIAALDAFVEARDRVIHGA